MERGIGDESRLEYILNRLENGKYLYLSDQKYLENLLSEKEISGHQSPDNKAEKQSLEQLEADLRDMNNHLERILKHEEKSEKPLLQPDLGTIDVNPRQRPVQSPTPLHYKSEQVTLVLSVVLGLISLQGIGYIYIGKIARGAGILALSLLLFTLWISYVMGVITKDSVPSFVSFYLLPITAIGYLGLYVFQILDSRKLCATYNEYISEQGKRPPWW